MSLDLGRVIVSATKPQGKPARMVAEMGIRIVPIEEDEGNDPDVSVSIVDKGQAIEVLKELRRQRLKPRGDRS